jgi:hypothetical protein
VKRIKEFFRWAWIRLSIARYRRGRAAVQQQDEAASERIDQLRNGGRPYGDRGWGHIP